MSEREEIEMLERREATEVCRCRGCGGDEPMACGSLCADCSWEDHLAGMAHTGDSSEESHVSTPACCRASRAEERAYFAAERERT